MEFWPTTVLISWTAETGTYEETDYAVLFSNAGSGAINWEDAVDGREIPNYGPVTVGYDVRAPGDWIFGVEVFDQYGNEETGGPGGTVSVPVCCTPQPPEVLTFNAYNKTTKQLTLNL